MSMAMGVLRWDPTFSQPYHYSLTLHRTTQTTNIDSYSLKTVKNIFIAMPFYGSIQILSIGRIKCQDAADTKQQYSYLP